MLQYFARRLLLMIPTLLGISVVSFMIMQFVPGGPVDQIIYQSRMGAMSGEAAGGGSGGGGPTANIPQEAIEEAKKAFHFDKPWYTRYFYWLNDAVRLNLGFSYRTFEPVTTKISERFPVSIYFGLIGFTLSYLVCVPLGVWKAIRHGSAFDWISSAIVFIGYSIPGFVLGTVLLVLLGGGSFLDIFPLGKFRTTSYEDLPSIVQRMEPQDSVSDEFGEFVWEKMSLPGKIIDQLWHTALPLLCYMVGSFAVLTVLMKNSMLENLGQDYVRTAFAKGLNERRVMFLHVLRNSLIPMSTGLGHAIGIIMAGSYLIEKVFNINGLGMLGYTSLIEQDYPVAMGILMINALLVMLGNMLSDFIYACVDPRIRFN